ncbi:hypothetical protein BGZ70_008239 [Mortierella alpina]|uniref:Uncharacterized protein n=1 Tax=Mortierella alpina TaxID=64518 RepID=A0A9P6J3W1_MORAP|nr:hypothetical protein BGZ70_008239 [Mortierella alpina]
MGVHKSGAVLQSPLHPLHHARRNAAASSLPANYMRLKGRLAHSHSQNHSTFNAIGSLPKARLLLTHADLPRKTRPMTAPVHAYRIRPRCVRRNRISPHFHQHPVHLGQLQSFLSGPRFDGYNTSPCTATPIKSPPVPHVSDRSEEAEELDLEIDLDGVDRGYRSSDLPAAARRHPSHSHTLRGVTTKAESSSATSASSSSPSFPPTPLDTDPQQRQELMMLKREAFQELASQTQRFDDLFIAKMIYWESLSSEEKAQWLERGRQNTSCQEVGSKEVHRRQGQHQLQRELPPCPKSRSDERMEQDEIDELVNALECRATVKDYSALIAFERQAELDQKRRQIARTIDLDVPLYN